MTGRVTNDPFSSEGFAHKNGYSLVRPLASHGVGGADAGVDGVAPDTVVDTHPPIPYPPPLDFRPRS